MTYCYTVTVNVEPVNNGQNDAQAVADEIRSNLESCVRELGIVAVDVQFMPALVEARSTPSCPDCGDVLTDRAGGPVSTYCDTCDREVANVED